MSKLPVVTVLLSRSLLGLQGQQDH